MRAQAEPGEQGTDTMMSAPTHLRPRRAISRRALRWVGAAVFAAVVFLLLPRFGPAPTVTFAAADLATGRDNRSFFASETDARGNRYVWAGPNAVAAFDFTSRKPLTVIVELRSAATVGGPDAPVRLSVDDTDAATTAHPDPTRPDFQPFALRVPRLSAPVTQVRLVSTAFSPGGADKRKLGVMVRAITVDRTEAWSTITRRAWLYWLVPLCALLVAAGTLLARRFAASHVVASLAGYGAILAAAGAAGAMVVAFALLLSIGALDQSTYYLWLFGTAYLALFGAVVACALPFGGPASVSLGGRVAHLPRIRRHAGLLRTATRVACFGGVLLFALSFFMYYGTGDVDRKLKWMGNIRAYGLVKAYAGIPDQYPPLTLVLLALTNHLGGALHLTDFAAFKLSLVIAFALTGAAFVWWRRDLLLAAALLLALLPNALALGYTDIYFAPTLIFTLWALGRRRFVAFSLLLAVTCLIKWQAAIIAPPLLLAAMRLATLPPEEPAPDHESPRFRSSFWRLAAIVLPGLAVSVGVIAVFGGAVFASLAHGFGERFLSANALNAPWLLTQALRFAASHAATGLAADPRQTIQTTDLRLTLGPKLLFAVAYLIALVRLWRGNPTLATALRWTLAAYLAYFAFNTGVHENHLFTAVILAASLAAVGGATERGVFVAVAVVANLNLVLFYGLRGTPRLPPTIVGALDWSVPLAFAAVALVVAFFVASARTEDAIPYAARDAHVLAR